LEHLRTGDVLLVCKLDRLSRSLTDLLDILKKIDTAGAKFRSLGESFETESPAGRMLMQMVGVFAEFEREIIRERVKRGLAHARANGRIGGGRYKLSSDERMEAIRLIRDKGKSQGYVAEKFRIDRSTVSRMMTEIRLQEELKGGAL
jgi:DNA invertase Pin-like site-specific DNA recombinase